MTIDARAGDARPSVAAPGDAAARDDGGEWLNRFAEHKPVAGIVAALDLFRGATGSGSGSGSSAALRNCEWALELLERVSVKRRPADIVELVRLLADRGQAYDVQVILENTARQASSEDAVALMEELGHAEADRLIVLFAAHRSVHDIVDLLAVLTHRKATDIAQQVLRHAADGEVQCDSAPQYGVARLLTLLRHRGLDSCAEYLIERATPPYRSVEVLSGLAAALEAFQPGSQGLPDTVWERLSPHEFVSQVAQAWPDPELLEFKAAGRDRILSKALARDAGELQAIHAGLSQNAPHLAKRLIHTIAAEKEPGYIADFADQLPRDNPAPRTELVRTAVRSRQGAALGELVQLWRGKLRGDRIAFQELLNNMAAEAEGKEIVEAARYLDHRNSGDLAAELVERAVSFPRRFQGAELAQLILLIAKGKRRTRISKVVARKLGEEYEKDAWKNSWEASSPPDVGSSPIGCPFLVDYVQTLRGQYAEGIEHLDDAVVSTGKARLVREYATELRHCGERKHAEHMTRRIPI
ncbi:MAG: hypothetical protein JO362_22790 [Streptomycetaceae bacterium]|nr:hypothetical protein [Streptomycetaceae bacterium]